MIVTNNQSLASFNSFGLSAIAESYFSCSDERALQNALKHMPSDFLVLGGGSNMLLIKDRIPAVLHNQILGIKTLKETEDYVLVEVGGGVVWHDLVIWAVNHDYGGIENLALIPGKVGAAPIQNIGAYGAELADVFQSLWAIDRTTGHQVSLQKNECNFGYRDSVFKKELKDKLIITRVIMKLNKPKTHTVNTEYGAIQGELENLKSDGQNIKEIAQAVINIRNRKLPDPKVIGNAGSFFKNPIIGMASFQKIKIDYPEIPSYPISADTIKIPAGWLIEQCGFKGKKIGNTGCYKNQALVIVNHGNADGQEIYDFALEVKSTVFDKFGIEINPEVNLIN